MSEVILMLIFLIHYYSFALFFYFIFKITPMQITLKDKETGKEINTTKLYLLCFCIAWIITIPLVLLNSRNTEN